MVIAPYLTLVQEDTTITWCLKGTLHTLQGIKHLHQDERKREQVSPKVGCQWWVCWALLGEDRRRGGEAETPGAEHRSRSQEQRGQWPLTSHPAHNPPGAGGGGSSLDILIFDNKIE